MMMIVGKSHSDGLTLVEVLISLVILGIGIAAAASLQAGSIRHSVVARELTQATRLAQNEVAWQRETLVAIDQTECKTNRDPESGNLILPSGFTSCSVSIEPCTLEANSIVCGEEVVPAAYRITVTLQGLGARNFVHSVLHTGFYVSGAAGGSE